MAVRSQKGMIITNDVTYYHVLDFKAYSDTIVNIFGEVFCWDFLLATLVDSFSNNFCLSDNNKNL